MESSAAEAQSPSQVTAELPFRSTLPGGPQRFLAHAIEHALSCKRRTARDFIRHFPPAVIMEGLEDEPELRANILVTATGVRLKVALKKSAESCGSDLQIALDEKETDAETVVALFNPDDRVRFLDNRALWSFLIEGEFWRVDPKKDPGLHDIAAQHICYLIERALDDQLLSHRDVVQGITVESMANLLPRSELPKIIDAALALGAEKKPFVERDLLEALGISTLTAHIPLVSLWTQVVVPFIAEPHGFAAKPDSERVPSAQPAMSARSDAGNGPPTSVRNASLEASPQVANSNGRAAAPAAAAPAAATAPAADHGAAAQAKPARAPAPAAASPRPAPVQAQAQPAPQAAAPKAQPSALGEDDAGLDLEVDELLGSLAAGGKPAPKKPARRPGSIPPTA